MFDLERATTVTSLSVLLIGIAPGNGTKLTSASIVEMQKDVVGIVDVATVSRGSV